MIRFTHLIAGIAVLTSAGFGQNTGMTFTHGVDQHFDVPYDPALVPQTGITVEAWVLYDESLVPAGSGFRWPTIMRQDVAPQDESFFLRVGAADAANRNLEFAIRTASGLRFAVFTFAPGQLSVWSHVAATYDGSVMRLYLNGVEVATNAVPAPEPLLDTAGVLRVGNGDTSAPGAETWSGQLDEVHLWPFARSQAEIQQTMGNELMFMPSGVVTFNLNNSLLDSSSGFTGTPSGGPIFTPSPPLTLQVSGATTFGPSSSTCGPIRAAIGSPTVVGNAELVQRCLPVPAGGIGFYFASLSPLTPPLSLFGIEININPGQITINLPATSGPLGVGAVATPVPNDPGLVGQTFFGQFVFLDPPCGSPNFTASEALALAIL